MLINFMVESWCVAGHIKKAKKIVDLMSQESICEVILPQGKEAGNSEGLNPKCRCCCTPDENTYAVLAAGWASVGKADNAAEVLLSMADKGFDASMIDLNGIVQNWKARKRRQVKGFEIPLPSVKQMRTPDGMPIPLPERLTRAREAPKGQGLPSHGMVEAFPENGALSTRGHIQHAANEKLKGVTPRRNARTSAPKP
eukprot:CAMPEP_0184308074 /NCGR_PEP_ID=MMETSP1049-20130417/16637_1 /TAXON_ID=77928 /ORGANISM="Proteomonas sulcata, Strain CCMP704" /LENGTH=197 /DNA_ID=CAMNT_0026620697 /DNA_START=56 /DNA_END=649 /DNA_ORIENTATION=+